MNWSKIRSFFFRNWPIIIIFLVVVIFFWKFIFQGLLPIPADTIVGMYHPWRDLLADQYPRGLPFKNFLITDSVRQQYPWRQLVIETFKQGRLPLWNPYNLTGTPLLANFQSAPFYIFNFLFFVFNFPTAWGILIFFQPLLAGVFLYLYLHHLKLQKVACLLGSISFAFSGFFIAWLEWGTLFHSALWLPLILLSIEKIIKIFNKSKFLIFNFQFLFWGFVFVFALAQSFFAGHLQTFFYVFLFSLIYLLWRLLPAKTGKRKIFLLFLILYSIFFILTSIQWRPTWELIRLSGRGLDQVNWRQSGWFIPWQHLIQFLAPDFFGNPTTLNYWGEWNYGEFIGYIGVIPLIFVLYAIFFLRTKYLILYTLFFILFLSFALPTPWAKLPYLLKLPLVSTSQPTRLLFLVDFCLAVLAAFGFDGFLKKKKVPVFFFFTVLVYGCLWLFVLVTSRFWPQVAWVSNLAISKRNLILPTAMLLAGAFLIWLMSFPPKKLFAKLSLILLLFLICFDLLRFGWKFTPFTKKDWLFPTTEAIGFLKSDEEIFRIMAVDRRIFPPNFSAVYKLQDVAGYDPLYLLRYGELMAASERGEPNISSPFGFNRIITPQNWRSRLIDLLNVKYILSLSDLNSSKLELVFQESESRVYENKNVIPRAFMVYDYRVAKSKSEAINLLFEPKIDLRKTAILEEEINLVPIDQSVENKVIIVDYQPNLVEIEVVSDRPGILVLTDAYYLGWQAAVDGKETEIYRVDYHFRAIIVPEGEHQLVFKYGG